MYASRAQLRLLTLDGDGTLYEDGKNFSSPVLGRAIAALLRRGLYVAVVTAAGYGYDAKKYMRRLGCLPEIFAQENLEADAARRFFLMGGESNYLLRSDTAGCTLSVCLSICFSRSVVFSVSSAKPRRRWFVLRLADSRRRTRCFRFPRKFG